jgi:DMSO reductase family type II enzyme heme b subunit
VEDLVAEGPGTLAPAGKTASRGKGVYSEQRWSVVFVRPRPAGLTSTSRTQIAFAVWNGAQGETGSRKMRSAWIPLAVREP